MGFPDGRRPEIPALAVSAPDADQLERMARQKTGALFDVCARMGAIVAGLYASGMSPDEIEELLVSLVPIDHSQSTSPIGVALQNGPALRPVASAEQVEVVEQVVEVVELAPRRVARVPRQRGVVGIVKGGRETAEELGHGEIRFAVTIVDRRINQHRLTVAVCLRLKDIGRIYLLEFLRSLPDRASGLDRLSGR